MNPVSMSFYDKNILFLYEESMHTARENVVIGIEAMESV